MNLIRRWNRRRVTPASRWANDGAPPAAVSDWTLAAAGLLTKGDNYG
jgi:hypothetical protein